MHARLQRALDLVTETCAVPDDRVVRPGKWSPAGIVEHLALTFLGTAVPLERSVQVGHALGGRPSLRQRLAVLTIRILRRLPSGQPAPAFARPRGTSGVAALTMFRTNLARLDAALNRCESAFGARRRVVDHPVLGGMNVSQWRSYHLIHTLHHLRQLRALNGRTHPNV